MVEATAFLAMSIEDSYSSASDVTANARQNGIDADRHSVTTRRGTSRAVGVVGAGVEVDADLECDVRVCVSELP